MACMDRKFNPDRGARLDNPKRRKVLDPDKVFAKAGVKKGWVAADIGAGSGFHSFPLAELLGSEGKVYAIDISRKMLDLIEEKKKKLGVDNIETVLSTEDAIPLPDSSCDFAMMFSVLHELEGIGTLTETRRILNKDGKLLIADWRRKLELKGPPLSHRMKNSQAIAFCESAGFTLVEDFVPGPSHFGLIFRVQ